MTLFDDTISDTESLNDPEEKKSPEAAKMLFNPPGALNQSQKQQLQQAVKESKSPISSSLPHNYHFLGAINKEESLSDFDEKVLNNFLVKRFSSAKLETTF